MDIKLPTQQQAPLDGGGGGGIITPPHIICKVCTKEHSKYSCPRCALRYCSLACYKAHGTRCTEGFYKEQVEGELRGRRVDRDDQQKVLEILKRVHVEDAGGGGDDGSDQGGSAGDEGEGDEEEEEEEEEEDGEGLGMSEAVIRKLAAGEEVGPGDLSPEELAAFHRAVANGELSHMIAPWEPWWRSPSAASAALAADGTRLVRDLPAAAHAPSTSGAPESELPPTPEEPLAPLASLVAAGARPHPDLSWHVLDVMYGYCHTMCLHNGDWRDDPPGAGGVALAVSACLAAAGRGGGGGRGDALPASAGAALEGCVIRARSPAGGSAPAELCDHVVEEVAALCGAGRAASVLALVDLEALLLAAAAESRARGAGDRSGRKALRAAARKARFLASWANEGGGLRRDGGAGGGGEGEGEGGGLEEPRGLARAAEAAAGEAAGARGRAAERAQTAGAGAVPPRPPPPPGGAGGRGRRPPLVQEVG